MKLLTTSFYHYYGSYKSVEPQFYYLYRVPREMGHEVDFYDYLYNSKISLEHMRRQFLTLLRGGRYDAVFLATYRDEFDAETLAEARKFCPIIAWNSDDEWRWDSYSKARATDYTFMVTNSPDVYAANKSAFPNLVHAQWACTGFWEGLNTAKSIDFSFAGQVYGSRAEQLKYLSRKAGLRAFGKNAGSIYDATPEQFPLKLRARRRFQEWLMKRFILSAYAEWTTITFEQVNEIWNRSKVSFTPLESSSGTAMQIKSRVMDMGLSGTVMLAPRGAGVERYYDPGTEFIEFDGLEDCAEKAKALLQDQPRRTKIGDAYAKRTRAEHMWHHRIDHVLRECGLSR